MKVFVLIFIFFINNFLFSENCYNPKEIEKSRHEKNYEFKNSNNSPLTDKDKKKFKGLKYFKANKDFSVNAVLELNRKFDTIIIKTSKSDERKMFRFGYLKFKLFNKEYKLSAFINVKEINHPNYLFIPFTDKTTNDGRTYSAGRYLDIEFIKGKDNYCLDFNYAYNPYCAYNKKYSCPLVPFENHLDLEILAGEKNYNK